MATVPKITTNIRLGIVIAAVAVLGLVLTVSLFVALEIVAAFLALFLTVGVLAVLLFVWVNTVKINAMRGDLRRLEKILKDTAGSAGKSAPLIREMHRNFGLSQSNDLGVYISNPEPQQAVVPHAIEKLSTALEERENLESQALRQIVAEARLIRMYVERAENNHAKK